MTVMIRNAHANLLCTKAQEDEAALSFPLSDHIFGFHAQQSCEKLLKALLSSLAVVYPKTHSLEQLADLLAQSNELLPGLSYDLLDLEPFAVELRYDAGGSLLAG
jgi:HEPN domain-containing protein